MKKVILIFSLMAATFAQNVYAGCTMKCITRNPFNGKCIVKTKVCGISADGVQQELERGWHQIESAWHRLYSTALPESLRNIINNNPMTIIGAAFGGLQGTAIGAWLDSYIVKAIQRMERTKEYIQEMPSWKQTIIWEGYAIATGRQLADIGAVQAQNVPLLDGVEPLYNDFMDCVNGKNSPVAARQECLRPFHMRVLNLTYEL